MMAGLLDMLNTPQGIGLLSAIAGGAAGARRGEPLNSVGRGAMAGLQGYTNAQDQARQDAQTGIANQYRTMQMDQMQQQIAQQKAQQQWQAGLPNVMKQTTDVKAPFQADDPFGEGVGAGMSDVVGQAPDMQARQDYMMRPENPFANRMLEQQLFPKAPDYKVVGNSLVGIGPDGVKPVYTAPKEQSMPGAVQEYQFATSQGYKGTFDQWKKDNARAGAARISQNNFGEPKPFWNQKTGRYEFYQFDKAGNPRVAALPEGAAPVEEGKLPEGQAKQVVGVNNLQGAIGEYVNQLKTWHKADALRPDERAAMGVKYNNMMLQAKEAYNLGVLNGPDFEILTSVVTDPRSFTGAITSTSALEKQAQELSRIMNGIKQSAATKPRPMNGSKQQPAMSLDEYLTSQGH